MYKRIYFCIYVFMNLVVLLYMYSYIHTLILYILQIGVYVSIVSTKIPYGGPNKE